MAEWLLTPQYKFNKTGKNSEFHLKQSKKKAKIQKRNLQGPDNLEMNPGQNQL